MPHVFSFENMSEEQLEEMEAREDDMDFDPYAAPPSEFQYLDPPDFGGPPSPVRVVVRKDQVNTIKNKPSLIDKLLGQRDYAAQQDQHRLQSERWSAVISEAIVKLGVTRAYCRYDGGNDEGFAWFDHGITKDGATRSGAEIAAELKKSGIFEALGLSGNLDHVLDDCAAGYWAATLLGRGFGTGEYVMYGAFWVDLETGVATDDFNAAPVVKNITIKPE